MSNRSRSQTICLRGLFSVGASTEGGGPFRGCAEDGRLARSSQGGNRAERCGKAIEIGRPIGHFMRVSG